MSCGMDLTGKVLIAVSAIGVWNGSEIGSGIGGLDCWRCLAIRIRAGRRERGSSRAPRRSRLESGCRRGI